MMLLLQKQQDMKRTFKLAALVLLIVLGSSSFQSVFAQYANDGRDREVTYQDFYDQLSPYGRWVDNPDYGYVWVPDAGPDFQPYSTEGHWVWTEDAEWMWVSDYDWGWAPFHYGRWDQDEYYGWFWVPGYEWSPAWVAWRDGGDYYGWAPIRPGINIDINFNMGSYAPPYDFWCFTPRRYILYPRVRDYCVDYRRNYSIYSSTTVISFNIGGRWGYRSGPRRWEAERYCGTIRPVRFRDSYTPGRTYFRDNEVRLYRPNVRRDEGRGYAPQHFERFDRNNNFRGNRDNGNGNGRINNGNRDNGNGNGRINNGNRDNGNRDNGRINDPRGGRIENGNRDNGRINDPRGGRVENRDIRRNDNGNRQPQNNGNPNTNGGRRFERTDNNTGNRDNNPGNGNPRNGPGVDRPQSDRTPAGNGNIDNRRMERRPQEQPQSQPRQFERRSQPQEQPQSQTRQFERRSQPQQQPRQIERRQESGGGNAPQRQAPQVERRSENGGGNAGRSGGGRRRF